MNVESPKPTLFGVLQAGQNYMKTWPMEKKLAFMFPENRVINATRFALRFMPPLAMFTLSWQIALAEQWQSAIATALFACSLPLQGLWWLGKRSVKPLPPHLATWFYQAHERLNEADKTECKITGNPNYQSLAELLKIAFKQRDSDFFDDL